MSLKGTRSRWTAALDPSSSRSTRVSSNDPRRSTKLATATTKRATARSRNDSLTQKKRLVAPSQLRPLGDRVVIKPTPREEMTKSGIVLPDTAKEKPQEGEIIAAGPGKINDDGKREPMDVSVGQKVLYAKYAGTEFKVEDEELLIVSQKDILAIVEG